MEAKLCIFKHPAHPIFENFITSYMEKTQRPINNTINLSQFMTLEWTHGFPEMMILLFSEILGNQQASSAYFKSIEKDIRRLSRIEYETLFKTDLKLQGVHKMRIKQLD